MCETFEKRKEKKNVFANLDTKNINDNKTFWQNCKAFFLNSDQFTLIHNDEIISDDKNIAKTFNGFFSNIVKNLNLKVNESSLNQNVDFIEDLVLRALY